MLNGTINNSNFNPENSHIARYESVIIDAIHSQDFLFEEGFNMSKFKRKIKLCECGCGERVNLKRKFIYGHNRRGLNWKQRPPNFEAPICACGCCKKKTKWDNGKHRWNKFIIGHHSKNKICSQETKDKIGRGNLGKFVSQETRDKLSKYVLSLGESNPMKTIAARQRCREKWTGKNNPNYGKGDHLKGDKNPMRRPEILAKFIGRKRPEISKENHPFYGKKRINHSILMIGRGNPNWKGGISKNPYCEIWSDKEYKQSIFERDNNECQNPKCRKNCNHLPLGIHHIDHNKQECNPWDLITTCAGCNSRANFNKPYWKKLYQGIMTEKYGYKYE